jgi:hypothetical protein
MKNNAEPIGFSYAPANSPKRVLNAGSGSYSARALHPIFGRDTWEEIRLDIDPQSKPDIVASITDMRSSCAAEL